MKSWLTKLRRSLVFSLLAFFLAGGLFLSELRKIQAEPITAWTEELGADCAVVLTGGAGRVREGFALLKREQVRTLIISGVHPAATLMDLVSPWEWVWGLPEEKIVLEKNARTTYGNAQQSLPLVEALRCRDVLVVTSQAHMYRSFRTFVAVFPREIQLRKFTIPSSRGEASILGLTTEVLKSLFYSIWAY